MVGTIGIDSLRLRIPDFPFAPKIKKNFIQSKKNIGQVDEEDYWVYKSDQFPGTSIDITFRPIDRTGKQSLFIYISSLARLAFSNNYTPFSDINSAIEVVKQRLAQIVEIPSIGHLAHARLSRLDVFCHYDCGFENIENTLNVINRATYPRRNRGPYLNHGNETYKPSSNNGVSFSTLSKSIHTNFYDKLQQCLDPKTKGYLRHEIQISGARVIENMLGIDKPVFKDINQLTIDNLFTKDLDILRLNLPTVNKNWAEYVLKAKYGTKSGANLYNLTLYLATHPTMDKKQIAQSLGINQDTLQIKLNKIAQAGISPYILGEGQLLSPLSEKRSLIF